MALTDTMLESLISGGISSGGSFVNSLINGLVGRKRQQREFKQQEKLLNMQNDFSEKMWNMQNAYNDPSAQMERLTNAGINPIDAASGVSGNAGNSASITSSTAPSVPQLSGSPVMTENVGDSFNRGVLFRHQLEAQEWQNKISREEWLSQMMDNQYKPMMKHLDMQTVLGNLKNLAAQYNLTTTQNEELQYTLNNILPQNKRVTKAQADNMEATAKLTLGQVEKNNQEIEILKKQRDEIQARINNYNQSTDLMAAQTADVEADKQLKEDEHQIKEIDKKIKGYEEDNARLTNEYKSNLSDAGYDPDQKFNYDTNSPITLSHNEGARYAIGKIRNFKEKVKKVEEWNERHPSQPMMITSYGDVQFVNQYNKNKNKKKSKFTYSPIEYGY